MLLATAGCGAGAHEPTSYTVALPTASFPARQRVASPAELRIAVRNDGRRALPDVGVSIDSFAARDPGPGPQSPGRAIWIVDREPAGGAGAGGQTWALGALAPGATRVFAWRVTPVSPGCYTVRYRVDAGSGGLARLAGGGAPSGAFAVAVSARPADARVDPISGRVVPAPRATPRPDRSPAALSAGGAAG